MTLHGALAYTQARLQAHHGRQPGNSVFQSLAAISEFRPYLEQARATALEPWTVNISLMSTNHEIERLLRASLRARIEEVTSWVPAPWREVVRWTRVLLDLPALEHLLRGEPPFPWMFDEDNLKALAIAEAKARRRLLEHGEYAPLARGPREQPLLECWLAEWRRRLPEMPRPEVRRLEQLVALVWAHRASFASAPVGEPASARMAWEARRQLEAKVVQHFRRAFMEPAAVFAHLLLLALEFERLRGALVSRRLFFAEAD